MRHLGQRTLDPVYRARVWPDGDGDGPTHGVAPSQHVKHSRHVEHSWRPVCRDGPHMPHLWHITDGSVYALSVCPAADAGLGAAAPLQV